MVLLLEGVSWAVGEILPHCAEALHGMESRNLSWWHQGCPIGVEMFGSFLLSREPKEAREGLEPSNCSVVSKMLWSRRQHWKYLGSLVVGVQEKATSRCAGTEGQEEAQLLLVSL